MSKRGNGEGYVYKNQKGKWVVRIQEGWLDNGNPRFKSFTSPTRGEALKRLTEYKSNLQRNKNIDNCMEKLDLCINKWVDTVKALTLKPTSLDRLRCTIKNNVSPYIGSYLVEDITASVIQDEMIAPLIKQRLSYSTIKKAKEALNGFFKYCVVRRVLPYNPVDAVVLPKKSNFLVKPKPIRALSTEEIERFTQVATSMYKSVAQPVYRNGYGYLFVLYMGLRCGEALGLQYKHIDLKNRTVNVEQSLVSIQNREKDGAAYVMLLQDDTKSESGIRKIQMCSKAAQYIEKHMELHYKGNPEEFVFLTANGTHIRTRNFERDLNAIFKAADINASGLHILRHTMASLMFAKGIDIKYISEFLGHSSVSITYNHYIHLIRELKMNAIELLDCI